MINKGISQKAQKKENTHNIVTPIPTVIDDLLVS